MSKFIRLLINPIYQFAFNHPNQSVIVQNQQDAKMLVEWGVLDSQKVRLLRGSGVKIEEFTQFKEPEKIPTICFAARLIYDKGVSDFISAARLLKKRGVKVHFYLAGDSDIKNPSGLNDKDLKNLKENKDIEFLGHQTNIAKLYANSHIVCLPSYREGLPKALMEAAAASRAIVTTNVPGCRDAIIPNKTGLLVPVKDPEKLADALQWLIEHPLERIAMGRAGRQLAEKEFRIEKITKNHLDIYKELLNNLAVK